MADSLIVSMVPGPKGDKGDPGTNGTNGVSAYTTLSASYTMPATASTSVANVLDSTSFIIGQYVFLQSAGEMKVTAKPSATQITLQNTGATGNAAAGTIIPLGNQLSPSGPPGAAAGPTGAAGGQLNGTYPNPNVAITTTKGDLIVNNGSGNVRLAVGPEGTVPVSRAAAATGLAYETLPTTGAPASSGYWVKTADAGLSNEADMSALATGYVKVTTGTGVPTSQAIPIPLTDGGTGSVTAAAARSSLGAAALGANADITSLTGLTTPLSEAQGGTGLSALPYFSANRNGTDQTAVASATPTKIAFNNEINDSDSYFDSSANNRFTPLKAGFYNFVVGVALKLPAASTILRAYLYKNGAKIAECFTHYTAGTEMQSILTFQAAANGSTDFFEAWVEHNAGSARDVDGAITKTFFTGHLATPA